MTNIVEDIRVKIGGFLLKKRQAKMKRDVVVRNLKDIKTAGIIFEVLSGENIKLVKQFIKELKTFGIDTKALGYVNDNRKNIDLIGDSTFSYVSKDEYSFFYDSKDEVVNSFIEKPFNLMIIYCENDTFPLRHIGTLSGAELKVGEKGVCDTIMDIMIEIPENKGLPELQKQLLYYLSMINK